MIDNVMYRGTFSERANRAYLGLDDCDLNDADAALARLLALMDALEEVLFVSLKKK